MIIRKLYNYDKILNGSFRDFVPDDYESGYQMVTWALAKKDPQIWNKVLKFTAEQPFTLNPVNISLSRSSGLRKKNSGRKLTIRLKHYGQKMFQKIIHLFTKQQILTNMGNILITILLFLQVSTV